jgi:pimeloyl-ACP methyl ester carboxylesterase
MQTHVQTQTLKVNGLEMLVATAGVGPPVLLLHGFPDSHAVWRHQMTALAEAGFRAIAPDLRGYGGTSAPPDVAAYAVALLVADVIALLDALTIGKVALVGHDWGAALAWQVAMHTPERVERLVVLSVGHPTAFGTAGLAQRLRSSYMALFMVRGLAERMLTMGDWFFMRLSTSNRELVAQWRADFAAPGRLTAALNYYRANARGGAFRLRAVTMPVLGMWSSGDTALTEGQMRNSARYVDAPFRYERIDGADHWLQLGAPARVNALLVAFLSGSAPTLNQ